MSFIRGILKPDPIRELETFLEAHPDQISKDDINHAIEAARTGKLTIKGSIDYEGYEDVTVEFKMPSTLKPIQTTMPVEESPYTNFIIRAIFDAEKNPLIICGAGIDAYIVPTGGQLDEFGAILADKKKILEDILLSVLFYEPSDLAKNMARLSKDLGCIIYTPNWTRNLSKESAQVKYTRKNAIRYHRASQILTVKLGSPVDDEVIREAEHRARTSKLLLAVGISFRPFDRLREVLMSFVRDRKWIVFIDNSDKCSVQEISQEVCCMKLIEFYGALAVFKDEQFTRRVAFFKRDSRMF